MSQYRSEDRRSELGCSGAAFDWACRVSWGPMSDSSKRRSNAAGQFEGWHHFPATTFVPSRRRGSAIRCDYQRRRHCLHLHASFAEYLPPCRRFDPINGTGNRRTGRNAGSRASKCAGQSAGWQGSGRRGDFESCHCSGSSRQRKQNIRATATLSG